MGNDSITKALKEKLSTKLNQSELEAVLKAVDEVLADYEVIPNMTDDSASDTMPEIYLRALYAQGRSLKTIERYRYVINRFLETVSVNTRNITTDHIRQYLADERERGLSERTRNGYRDVFSAYFGWLRQAGLINKNPVIEIEPIKCRKKVRKIFTDVEIENCGSHAKQNGIKQLCISWIQQDAV